MINIILFILLLTISVSLVIYAIKIAVNMKRTNSECKCFRTYNNYLVISVAKVIALLLFSIMSLFILTML